MQKTRCVGTNGGTAAGLVGRYDEVAARIRCFHNAGIELFMLPFQPFKAEMRRFALEVIPRVPRAQTARTAEPAARSQTEAAAGRDLAKRFAALRDQNDRAGASCGTIP
ncbi:hypothetical protein J2R78_008602 [Bradyrhizobium sp. USDA 4538]|nr:hypothetical protein [Bradyrhizobium sp. USDA 4538]MCP1907110.1 hypothetical protein [Bradyrhizobium sp. USDA 4537]MCP1985585.1 hypothetical protein [Bradyrhizobium sp. USDA 4539]